MPWFKKRNKTTNYKKRNYRRKRYYGYKHPYGKARPMRALKTTYRSANIYRFVRETVPTTVSPTLIDGTPNNMGYFQFNDIQISDLVNFSTDFSLFANYKIDKIVTVMIPLWQDAVATQGQNVTVPSWRDFLSYSPQLFVTRVNNKTLNNNFSISGTSDAQREQLAQLQSKSTSVYTTKKWLTLTTLNPKPYELLVEDPTNQGSVAVVKSNSTKWLSILNNDDAQFQHNSLLFVDRLDGRNITDQFKYRMFHKVYFRCSYVG